MKKISKKDVSLLNPNYRIITHENPNSPYSEAYRRIKVALDFTSFDNELKVVQVCSSIKGEGKTTTLLNVAAAYAENKKKVLVIDLDLRKPRTHRAFQIENKNGLSEVLSGAITLQDAIKHSEKLGFDLLNAGKKISSVSYALESKQLKEIFNELRNEYDMILVDCPPILAVSDSIIIASLCDAAIFVISQLRSERKLVKEALKTLKENNVNIIGCVFTELNMKNKANTNYSYYYNTYYGGANDQEKDTKK